MLVAAAIIGWACLTVGCLPDWPWTCLMKLVRSLQPGAVLLSARSACTACNWLSKLVWIPPGKWKLLTRLIRALTWVAAPLTVTVKLWLTELGVSSLSLTVQVTVVVPMARVLPEAGVQFTGGSGLSSSTTVGGVEVTVAPFGLVAFTVRLVG